MTRIRRAMFFLLAIFGLAALLSAPWVIPLFFHPTKGTPGGAIYSIVYPIQAGIKGNVPIKFFGRIVDQDGHPVPSATVSATYSTFSVSDHIASRDYTPRNLSTQTASDGSFSFTNLSGNELYIEGITKPDYYFSQYRTFAFVYSSDAVPVYVPDPARPEIYQLWHKTDPPDLMSGSLACATEQSGQLFSVTLGSPPRVTNGLDPQADFTFAITYDIPPKWNPQSKVHYPWKIAIDVPHGGIVVDHAPYHFLAPDAGYQPHFEYAPLVADPHWRENNQQESHFYIKSRDGQCYSAIWLSAEVNGVYRQAGARIAATTNPNGSPNLQPRLP